MVLKFHLIPGGFPEVSLMSFGNRSAMNGRCASGMTLPAVPLDLWKKKVPLNEALCDEAVFFGLHERTVPVIWFRASSSGSAPCPWGGSIWTAAGSRIEVRHGPWRCRSSELSTTVQQPATRFVIPNSLYRGWEVNIETCTQGWSSGLC